MSKTTKNKQKRIVGPGGFIAFTRAPWYKRWLYRLIGRKLKHNSLSIVDAGLNLTEPEYQEICNVLYGKGYEAFTPRKPYSQSEFLAFANTLGMLSQQRGRILVEDFPKTANAVRPGTFDEKVTTISEIITNEFYKKV